MCSCCTWAGRAALETSVSQPLLCIDLGLAVYIISCRPDNPTCNPPVTLTLIIFVCCTSPSFSLPGFAVTGHIDGQKNSRIFVSEVLPDGQAFNEGAYVSLVFSTFLHTDAISNVAVRISWRCVLKLMILIRPHKSSYVIRVTSLKLVNVCLQVCVPATRSWSWTVGACGVWTWRWSRRCLLSKPSTWAWGATALCPQLWHRTTRLLHPDSDRRF